MKNILAIALLLLAASCSIFGKENIVSACIANADTIYIPKDLDDCFIQIDKILPDSTKKAILSQTESKFTSGMHMSLGIWMRNNWGLWEGSRLSKYFNDKGIYHPDDISGIILTSYYRHVMGKSINLDEQIKYYQNYWKVVKQPSKDSFPKGVKHLDFNSGMYYDSKSNGQGYIHVGTSSKSGDVWLYDYYLGWAKVSKADVKRLEQNPETREDVLIEIYKRSK